jgi:hypothetical protein
MKKIHPKKMHISGAYTFISQDELASQLVDVYYEMKQLYSDQLYRLYVHFDFLDSKAKKVLLRFLSILDSASKKESMPTLRIHYLYSWDDEDMEELGLILADSLTDSVRICQVDSSVLRSTWVA